MLTQIDVLRRMRKRTGLFMPGPRHDLAARPMRRQRTIAILEDGTEIALAYDETLELQAVVVNGPSLVAVDIIDPSAPETTHSLASGNGERELALPNTTAAKIRAKRINAACPRWTGVAVRIRPG